MPTPRDIDSIAADLLVSTPISAKAFAICGDSPGSTGLSSNGINEEDSSASTITTVNLSTRRYTTSANMGKIAKSVILVNADI